MTSPRLRLKVVKDAWLPAPDTSPATAPAMRVLDMSMLPFTLYVRVELPADQSTSAPYALHLIGRPAPDSATERFFATSQLPTSEPKHPGCIRRLLLVVMCEHVPVERYRLALVANRRHLCYVDVVKHTDLLRVVAPPSTAAAPQIYPVLISGTHKSGTTWLESILDAHPDFMVLHEANSFNILDPPGLRELVRRRQQHFRGRDYIRWMNPTFDVEDFSRLLQIALARDLMLRLGRAWGSRFVADRTPGYAGLYAHLPRFWEELRILHIVRHPLDVIVSRIFHELNIRRHGPGTAASDTPMLQSLRARLDGGIAIQPGEFVSDDDAASGMLVSLLLDWQREQNRYLAAARHHAASFHLVRYEDLLADFSVTAARIFAFLGTEPDRTDIVSIAERTSFQVQSGGRAAGTADARSFFRKGVARDWKNVFSPQQAANLWRQASQAAAAFGYTLD